ncbi:autotransporter adhesin [Burkholderia vietnamiensis]|nr:autotransporter adhesin [Burkholderia vietnamiensis]
MAGTKSTAANGATAYGAYAQAQSDNTTAVGFRSIANNAGSIAIGYQAQAIADPTTAVGSNSLASGNNASVFGASASATQTNSLALGAYATAAAANSVALGNGSIATEANTVSVGSAGSERRITNVAPGINPTDAVNVSQLGSVQSSVNHTARLAYAGIAGATALTMIPEVDPGSVFAMGIATAGYQGYQAMAIGFSARVAKNIKVKGGVGVSAAGSTYGVGVSYQW